MSISQNQPCKMSSQFKFSSPARFAPLLSITTFSGQPLFVIARAKKDSVTNFSRCQANHWFIKRITGPMQGFKAFHSAAATIAGIEMAHMIRKGQFRSNGLTAA